MAEASQPKLVALIQSGIIIIIIVMGGSISNIDNEIEEAFAAGAMPPEWRSRLVASGLDEGGVDKIAADIAETYPTLEFVWSKEAIAFAAFDFVLGGLILCLGVAGLHDGKNAVAGGLLVVVMTAVVAVVCECERRWAETRRARARIVLENSLLPPV